MAQPSLVEPCPESGCIGLARVEERLEALDARVGAGFAALDARADRSEARVLVELGAIRAAQEAEVSDRTRLREARYAFAREVCTALLRPQVIVPLVVLALAALAIATGVGVRYGDLVIDGAGDVAEAAGDAFGDALP